MIGGLNWSAIFSFDSIAQMVYSPGMETIIKLSKNQALVVGAPTLALTPDSALGAVHKYEDAAKYYANIRKRSLATAAEALASTIREKFDIGYTESRRAKVVFNIG